MICINLALSNQALDNATVKFNISLMTKLLDHTVMQYVFCHGEFYYIQILF